MATAKKAAAKKSAAGKKAAGRKSSRSTSAEGAAAKKRTPNASFMRAMTPSPELAAIVGSDPLPRTEVTKKVWDYIKSNNLQDASKKTMINADDRLKGIFGDQQQVSMFEMTKLINAHLR